MKGEMKPCVMCGSEHRDLMGYDYYKVSCSNEECPISYLVLTKDEWNYRVATETEKRLTAIATKHATRADELYEALENLLSKQHQYRPHNKAAGIEHYLISTHELNAARKVLNKSQKESDGE
nr:hypothetical protein [uncultured Vibrio sp.]